MSKVNLGDGVIVDMAPPTRPSSTIKEIGYHENGRLLLVRFKKNIAYCYKYSPILPQAYKALKEAPSAGSFLQQNIVKNNLVTTVILRVTAP